MSINLAITVNSVFERPRDRERMDLVTGQKKNQSQVRTMKTYSKVPESRDKEEQKAEDQQDIAKSDKSNVIENKDENKITTVKHLRFGIENILQQESKAVKTERQIRESVSLGLSAVSGFYGQPFSLQKGGKLGTCYPYCSEVVLPWRETGSEKTTNCQITRRVGHPYQNRTPPKRKKPRTSFSRMTIIELEKRFDRQKYLASSERTSLAKSLKISDSQVKTWFQNRRTKWRRQAAEEKELERQAASRLLHVASAINGFSAPSPFVFPEKNKDSRT